VNVSVFVVEAATTLAGEVATVFVPEPSAAFVVVDGRLPPASAVALPEAVDLSVEAQLVVAAVAGAVTPPPAPEP